jgi:Fic family protein
MTRTTGKYERSAIAGEEANAFIPYALPPKDPPLSVNDPLLKDSLIQAEKALGRLDASVVLAPSVLWFVYGLVRAEAVLSSQIEGTQATLMDLLNFEATKHAEPAVEGDIHEVCNYVDALYYARSEIGRARGLPLSVRLLNETHKRLLKGVRGASKQPGQIRTSQNWIGGTRPGNAVFVPPPPHHLTDLLGEFENYIHNDDDLPPLIRIALLHVQFETIHPYLDGNGRIGRLMITLLLEDWKQLSQPLLYLSLFFRRHQQEYYQFLSRVRTDGDWENWIRFFLEGVSTVAEEAVITARDLFTTVDTDRLKVLRAPGSSVMALRLLQLLPEHPIITIGLTTKLLKTTKPTAIKAVGLLENLGILVETTGRKRDRTFNYAAYMKRLARTTSTG